MVYLDGNTMAQSKPPGTQYVPGSTRVKVRVKKGHTLNLNLHPDLI